MSEPRYIEVEGDVPKVEPTRKHFAALIAGLKTAEECARLAEARLREVEAERDALRRRLFETGADLTLQTRVAELEAAINRARNDIGLTVYEGTPVSVWSGKNIEAYLGEAVKERPL